MERQPPALPAAFRPRLMVAALALVLAGCGASPQPDRVAALEERLASVEKRAEAAEKRARNAEDIARHAAPNPYVSNDAFPQLDPDVNQVTDPSTEDPQFQNGPQADNGNAPPPPPSPVIPNSG
ncbi:MAG: hypothetical protein IH997_07740 [Proteobacteria bacterium]|nr:hypothetical protein [Pseudomonadota bacterium]